METKNSDFRGHQLRGALDRWAVWIFLIGGAISAFSFRQAYFNRPHDRLAWTFMAGMAGIAGANAFLVKARLASGRRNRGVELFKR